MRVDIRSLKPLNVARTFACWDDAQRRLRNRAFDSEPCICVFLFLFLSLSGSGLSVVTIVRVVISEIPRTSEWTSQGVRIDKMNTWCHQQMQIVLWVISYSLICTKNKGIFPESEIYRLVRALSKSGHFQLHFTSHRAEQSLSKGRVDVISMVCESAVFSCKGYEIKSDIN